MFWVSIQIKTVRKMGKVTRIRNGTKLIFIYFKDKPKLKKKVLNLLSYDEIITIGTLKLIANSLAELYITSGEQIYK